MCTVFLAWQQHPDYPLVIASNRDEFHQRPTAAAQWNDDETWFGGRDQRDGGSWLGVARSGRFAVITNFRAPALERNDAESRGALVRRWLAGEASDQFISHLERDDVYNGFNLLFGDRELLMYFSNRQADKAVQRLPAGIYGLSNGLLDEAWPKVSLGKRRFSALMEHQELDFDVLTGLMRDKRPAPDHTLPNTGVPKDWESLLSSLFITSPAYGTRATTVVSVDKQGEVRFRETRFQPSGDEAGVESSQFFLTPVADTGNGEG